MEIVLLDGSAEVVSVTVSFILKKGLTICKIGIIHMIQLQKRFIICNVYLECQTDPDCSSNSICGNGLCLPGKISKMK